MSRRVVMRLNEWTQDIKTVRELLDQAEEHGAGPRSKLIYAIDSDGHPCFYIDLPDRAVEAEQRRKRSKAPTKAQEAVREQLEARREALAAGEEVPGYVPPVAKNGRVKVKVRKKLA